MPIDPPRPAPLRLNRAASSTAQPYEASDRNVDVNDLKLRLWKACAPRRDRVCREGHDAQRAYLASRKPHQAPTILFDQSFYLNQLPWFLRSNVDPLDHYLRIGWSQGLSPHIAFDSIFLAEKLGIHTWSEPPLLAYFEHETEVSPHPLFDVNIYGNYVNLARHDCARLFEVFLSAWPSATAPFSRFFSLCFYGKFELVTRHGGINPLIHYLSADHDRKRDPCPMLHNRWYDIYYPALEREPKDPLTRYALVGLDRGNLPNPLAAQELRLLDADAGAPRELLLEYVDVSAMDAKWFSSRPTSKATHTVDMVGGALTHDFDPSEKQNTEVPISDAVNNMDASQTGTIWEMPSPAFVPGSDQSRTQFAEPSDTDATDTSQSGGKSKSGRGQTRSATR